MAWAAETGRMRAPANASRTRRRARDIGVHNSRQAAGLRPETSRTRSAVVRGDRVRVGDLGAGWRLRVALEGRDGTTSSACDGDRAPRPCAPDGDRDPGA